MKYFFPVYALIAVLAVACQSQLERPNAVPQAMGALPSSTLYEGTSTKMGCVQPKSNCVEEEPGSPDDVARLINAVGNGPDSIYYFWDKKANVDALLPQLYQTGNEELYAYLHSHEIYGSTLTSGTHVTVFYAQNPANLPDNADIALRFNIQN